MSTFYVENDVDDVLDHISIHYFNDGWDIEGLAENGTVYVHYSDVEFTEEDILDVEDVFQTDDFAYVVTSYKRTNDTLLIVFEMDSDEFGKWKEQIWAKFRAEWNNIVCPECGKRSAHPVAGTNRADGMPIRQFYCENCNNSWIGYLSGEFIRNGVLKSSWEIF